MKADKIYNGIGNHSVKELECICEQNQILLNEKQIKLQQKQSDIDELVDELTQIKLHGVNDETLEALIHKHTNK